ncbi:pyruvate dehydrogenase protein X component, mitochondrial-like isoform X3 [Oscarella lobularis]|uniref:pyruvate dehydrogenase protein X component, mitochondrial-like isoform X3 n=1 Tax=Oscarella lobularis TaxID=121494 RepID=UPI003313812A
MASARCRSLLCNQRRLRTFPRNILAAHLNAPPTLLSKTRSEKSIPIFLSPAVKRLVDEHGLQHADIPSSGKKGRLLKGDVLQYLKQLLQPKKEAPAAREVPLIKAAVTRAKGPSYEDVPNSSIRSVIAERVTQAKTTIPHAYASVDCTIDKVMDVRKKLRASGIVVTLNDFVVKAAALALKQVPAVNIRWTSNGPRDLADVDVSVAVASERGLITPIVKKADRMGVKTISNTVRELAAKAREGTLQPHEFQGGSFTISNLGMFGISRFNAIINPPQVCILAVGNSRIEPRDDDNKGIKSVVTVTMSSDARAVDEVLASEWLQAFKRFIEEPLESGLV